MDTGDCLQVFRGHFNQIYAVAFDGKIVASGGLDTTVRVWDAHSGYVSRKTLLILPTNLKPFFRHCTAMLQGHTVLVCSLQLTLHTLMADRRCGRRRSYEVSDDCI